ncbi:flagellar basal body-associated protein FliL [Sulfuricurvum sp.]|uniref:flagellar basal body-associated protein FliL n=1 Tax=Sulfuricurvum sp. TaxID=2025608 RepID=UPI003C48ABD9
MATKEKEHEEQAPEGGEKKKSNLLLIIIIVVLVLVLLIGGIVAALMMGNHDAEAESGHGAKTEVAADAHANEEGHASEGESSASHGSGEAMTEVGLMFPLDTFTVNLLSESGRRYLKVEMNLELEGEELSPELDTKKPIFRDIIIRILSSKSLEEISTIKGKEKLKEQIVNDLNMRLKDGKVKNVYFTDFVVQ